MRNVAEEDSKVIVSHSPAVSSHKALSFNLISPAVIMRLATRLSVGATKYGSVQWRQGINDKEYITDRFNHTVQHLLNFMQDGDTKDDNLGAMLWGIHCLMEVERLSPQSLENIIGISNIYGSIATKFHEAEMEQRNVAKTS